jgi:hypothetical protein
MKLNPHGKKVIERILQKCRPASKEQPADYEEVEKFIRMWRVHFVDYIKPKHLPRGWNIEHKMQRSFGEFSKFGNEFPRDRGDKQAGDQE